MACGSVDLPLDKEFHLFVCYESSKTNEVRILVDILERNGIKCCYYERDFIVGRSIMKNMYESIKKSMNMLVVLSEDFVNSVYCSHELEEALNLRIRGCYNLIPIKIEPCVIPECIRHLTYIDAEEDMDTAHTKIIHAVIHKEIQPEHEEGRNGKHMKFKVKSNKTSCLALSRFRLQLTDTDRARIWHSGFEISANLLVEIEETVNGSLYMRYLHIWKNISLITSAIWLCCISFLMTLFLLLLLTTGGKEKTSAYQPAGYVLIIGLPVVFFAGIVCLLLNCLSYVLDKPRGIYRIFVEALDVLQEQIWKISTENEEQTGAIFYISVEESYLISLNIMRYNLKTCKAYIAKRFEARPVLKGFCRKYETNEECTKRMFDIFLSNYAARMETVSSAQRHKMANGAKCACLLVEEWLNTQM